MTPTGNLAGIAWLMSAIPCFQFMNVLLREAATDLPPVEVMCLRNLFGFAVLAPWFLRNPTALRTKALGANALRALAHITGMVLWVTALTRIPLATATALAFSSPLFVVVAATLFLSERTGWHRWAAVSAGFAGVLIVFRPGRETLDPGALLVLASALCLSVSKLLGKVVSARDSTLSVVFYLNLFMALFALLPATRTWVAPSPEHYLWFGVLAALGAIAQACLTKALQCGELGALQPFEFVALIWASGLGYLLFGEIPAVHVYIGGAIIIAGASHIAHREARERKCAADDGRSASVSPKA